MATPLDGLKVVELARILAGPWAGQTLADLGAEVIKVEAPSGMIRGNGVRRLFSVKMKRPPRIFILATVEKEAL